MIEKQENDLALMQADYRYSNRANGLLSSESDVQCETAGGAVFAKAEADRLYAEHKRQIAATGRAIVDGEVRTVDPTTGGEKGAKLARFSLIPWDFIWALAEHYGRGARKYADRNWEKGYKWSLTVDAMQRHLTLWLNGEDNDEETGSSHLIAVAWHVVALWWFHRHNKGTDDVRRAA